MRDSTFDVMKGSETQSRNLSIDLIKVADYVIITIMTLVLSYGIMKIPFSEKIFKI